ncbi:MAG: type II toxin-antitoxin system Phd/YefM family antitoxin [Candidatus Eiseniibacteriota bacterium]
MPAISASRARKHWSKVLNRVEYRRERIWITRHGRAPLALVCAADLDRLENLENAESARRVTRPHEEVQRGETLPWFEVRERYGM